MQPEAVIQLIINEFKYKTLYHFTDKANLNLIREHGLLSKQQLTDRCVTPQFFGGDEQSHKSDLRNGIFDYVSLSFVPNHPMAYTCRQDGRHPDQVIIPIDPSVILKEETKISMCLANAKDAKIIPLAEGLDNLDTEIWRNNHGLKFTEIADRVTKGTKVEVLIHQQIEPNFLGYEFKPRE